MPDGPPPVCDAICQKILLDSDLLEHAATALCDHVKQYKGGHYRDPKRVIKAIIAAEDATFAALRVVVDEQGYDGSLPKCLS